MAENRWFPLARRSGLRESQIGRISCVENNVGLEKCAKTIADGFSDTCMLSPCSCFVVLCVSGGRFVTSGLYEAANVLLSRTTRFCALQAWALAVARRRGAKRAKVALARKLG